MAIKKEESAEKTANSVINAEQKAKAIRRGNIKRGKCLQCRSA